MSSRRSVSAGLRPAIQHRPVGVVSHDAALDSIALAEAAGLVLDDSQRETLLAWMGEREDGTWGAFECAHFMPRQNGKGSELEVRQLGGLFILGEELAIHTAHEFRTANEHFLRMARLVDGCPDLRRKVARIRYANGEQGIELKSGARLKFQARSGGSGRGFANASTVYYDEAMYLRAEMIGASLPTMSVNPNPQVVYTGSAGFAESSQMHRLRQRALSGAGGRLAFVEHTAEFDRDGNRRNRDEVDTSDQSLWFEANPTLGQRISLEFVEAEHDSMTRDEFLRERLGFWDPEPIVLRDRAFTSAQWMANVTESDAGTPVAFGVDVTPDRSTACIAAASAPVDGVVHIGVVDHRPGQGLGWVRERVDMLRAAVPSASWTVDARSQANGLVEATTLTARDMAKACGDLFDSVLEHRVRYRRQGSLEDAVSCAAKRPLGDAWAWDRRDSSGDISPLVAVTLALYGSRAEPPAAFFVY